ncbi:MAG: family 78 glycoside hydrolase catalytic domain [Planctomycetota bacterium]|nr:family 78 glycoside hydrolase catalytic domain [Planctomycetota bacterium]
MNWKLGTAAMLLLLGAAATSNLRAGERPLKPRRLRCEYLVNPLGIDVCKLRLSWALASERRGARQTSYRILVAESRESLQKDLGDVWDSGKVRSDQSLHIEYEGRPLLAGQRCFWRVVVWDEAGGQPVQSETAWWEMGLADKDWAAKWIAREDVKDMTLPRFRKTFILDKPIERARVYITSLGTHELFINGKRVGDHLLDPVESDFSRRVYYVAHDVGRQMCKGKNVLAVGLGRGWYINKKVNGVTLPATALLAELHVTCKDGTTRRFVTDETWLTHGSPVTPHGFVPGGETVDARREEPGWKRTVFDDSAWLSAKVVSVPLLVRSAQMINPNRVKEKIKAVEVRHLGKKDYLIDLGKNLTGWFRMKIDEAAGTDIRLTYYAAHFARNNKLQETMGQTDRYICRGDGSDVLGPRFNYRAYRFVKISGLSKPPKIDDATGLLICTDTPATSRFRCSDDTLNRLHEIVAYTHRCLTLGGIQVDCPHRERLGYGAEGQASSRQAVYNFDMGAFYTKWSRDFADGQDPKTGRVRYTAPFRIGSGGSPAWSMACIAFPWKLYECYGDRRALAENYETMRRWMSFVETKTKDGLITRFQYRPGNDNKWEFLSDWAAPNKTGKTWPGFWPDLQENIFFNTCNYRQNLVLMARIAKILGRDDDARTYTKKAEEIKKAINRKCFDAKTARYTRGVKQQTYLAYALLCDLVPSEHRARVLKNLVDDITIKHGGHLDTGVLGSYYMIAALLAENRSDLIHLIATRADYPGWGDIVARGSGTLWEHWYPEYAPACSSIHNSFLSIGSWFLEGPGGIRWDANLPGFKHFVIRPQIGGPLRFVECEYQSIRGPITCNWKFEGGEFLLTLDVPANTSATVYLPAERADAVREGGGKASQAEGVKFLRIDNRRAVFEVLSGRYEFRVPKS